MKSAAVVTIKNADKFTVKGAAKVADWLEQQAKYLRDPKIRKNLSATFRARYLYD